MPGRLGKRHRDGTVMVLKARAGRRWHCPALTRRAITDGIDPREHIQ